MMIMCHKNFNQVQRLIKRCLSDKTKVIVHFDAGLDISREQISNLRNIGVYICERRLHGKLDDRSLVDIAMEMVNKALQIENDEGIKFQYYCLLSGQDYLTKPIWYINDQLKKYYPTPYIDCTPYDRSNWIYHKFKYTKWLISFRNWIWNTFRSENFMRLGLRTIAYVWEKLDAWLHFTDYYKLRKKGFQLYGGSAWWILPDIAIKYIAQEYNSNAQYIQALLSTWTPEETFFQIMTMRSEASKLVHINPVDMVSQSCKTWAYFFDENKPFMGHPYIFTKNEYQKLINHDCWIARKFDMTIDGNIFDMLDCYMDNFHYGES